MVPQHVAIIMDGNGRWAQKKGSPTIMGHRAGADVARAITAHAAKKGISYLTLYTFSSENWKREQSWVSEFVGLLKWYLKNELQALMEKGVRVRVIGDTQQFSTDIQELIKTVEETTKSNTGITVILALSYGGRNEIIRACKRLAHDIQTKECTKDDITEEYFARYLDTDNIPDPDLLIRTSGEQRLSNFLLWQIAYTEFVFMDVLWPDMTPQLFDEAIDSFNKRNRRYGLYL